MNILIESGATKSTCIGYSGACTFFMYKTTGINATYATKEAIFAIFEEIIAKNNIVVDEVENIRYYGAGCFNINNVEKVKNVLSNLFPSANITVLSDLYAACHALCNHSSGFVGILGTGAASCLYDGTQIVNKAPSLGYLLGDEGSGTYLGKLFVIEYLTDKIELEIMQDFEKTFSVSKSIVFEKVYQTPNPHTFFASIPVFLQKHLENKQIKAIIKSSFQDFFDKQIAYYSEFPFSWFFCGSIAYYFQDILFEIAHKNNIKLERIIQECASDLVIAAH
jgi:N-acetylglucosamine kinase-like BadF-type ATPase